jgi:hypothetical protein
LGLTGLVIELLLPTALSAALLLVVAGHVSFWDLRTVVGLVIFGVLLVATSFFLSVRIDLITLRRRRKRGKTQLLNRADARSRLVKFILGGALVPIATLVAAVRVELPGRTTLMSLAIQAETAKPAPSGAARIGSAVLHAQGAAVRVAGIRALQAMGSGAALDQLLDILTGDPAVLDDGGAYQALVDALASYGARAVPRLLQLFRHVPASERRNAAVPPGWFFERYFARPFEEARSEIAEHRWSADARDAALARLQAARESLEQELGQLEGVAGATGASGVPALVMQAILAMHVDQEPGLLAFARETAADTSWPDAIRGQACLLIAKLGGQDDLNSLFAYVDDRSPVLQACAMQAVAQLQSKVSAAAEK